jgi:hypothetical protein
MVVSMTKDEALKLALEALETLMIERESIYDKAITAIKEALTNDALEKKAENARELGLDYEPEQEPVAWEGGEGWESLAWELCANENGEDSCNELIWEGGPIPEPWGDRWMKYEEEAKRLIALVQKHTTPPQRTWVGLTDEDEIDWEEGGNLKNLVKAIEAKLKEKNT